NVKIFSGFNREVKAFEKINEEHFRVRKHSWDLMVFLEVLQSTLMFCLEGVIVFLAIKLWWAGQLTVGDLTLIQLYIFSIFDRLWGMGKQVRAFYEALADANEMTEILLAPHEIEDAPRAKKLRVKEAGIEFRNVNFGYHERY